MLIVNEKDRNRALDGDFVFVELYLLIMDKGVKEDHDAGRISTKKKKNERAVNADSLTIADFNSNLEF